MCQHRQHSIQLERYSQAAQAPCFIGEDYRRHQQVVNGLRSPEVASDRSCLSSGFDVSIAEPKN